MAMPSEDYGQDAAVNKAVSPEQELAQLGEQHRALFEENGKRRAELVTMLRESSKRLHSDNREMEALRQWLLDLRPRDVPVEIEQKVDARVRAEVEAWGHPASAFYGHRG